jgi:UDP-N-acetylmuramoyl-tripeptide--D-alanyl-D-alanine ligase
MAGTRRVAVLGYMAELGGHERAGHEQVGRLAAELGVDRVVAVAENARPILDGAAGVAGWPGEAIFAVDQAAAIEIVGKDLRAGDVVLVKGSRYRTWDVVDSLRPEEGRP